MRVTLIVDDNTVYIGQRSAAVDLSALQGQIRAVQWQEHEAGVGHIEGLKCENFPLTAEEFTERFQTYADKAQAIFDAEDAETARLLAARAEFDALADKVMG